MSNHDNSSRSAQGSTPSKGGSVASYGSDMMAKASELAGDAAEKVKQGASDTVATVSGEVRQLLDHQVSSGATMVGHLATSAKHAADELEREVPQLAGVVRALGDRMDGLAENLKDQTINDLIQTASSFTRRQPALTFGLAALAGFFVMRTLKSAPSTVASPSIQPFGDSRGTSGGSRNSSGSSHGV